METNVIRFSVVPSGMPDNVAILQYGISSAAGVEGGSFTAILTAVGWNGTARVQYRTATVREVPVKIRYRKGYVPEAFGAWQAAGCAVKDITEFDTSFDKFWGTYGHKVGNKGGVEKRWGELSWEDKILAIGSIQRLRNYYAMKGYDMPYPETYLNQRRWENVFEN